jgi:hypothetical protein
MASLLFNSNFLDTIFPAEAQSDLLYRPDAIFRLHCSYDHWPVTDLRQEWGYHEFPAATAVWVAIFLACPSPRNLDGTKDTQIAGDDDVYWITLHSTIPVMEPIDVLCTLDADRMFFGVAVNHEDSAPLSKISNSKGPQAWLNVVIKNITFFKISEDDDQEVSSADLVIHGESLADWTKANVEPISVHEGHSENCWENFPKTGMFGSEEKV